MAELRERSDKAALYKSKGTIMAYRMTHGDRSEAGGELLGRICSRLSLIRVQSRTKAKARSKQTIFCKYFKCVQHKG